MKKVFVIFLIFSIILIVNTQRSRQQSQRSRRQGQIACKFPYSGQSGICARFSQCQSVQIAYYQYRVQPTYCYHDPLDPVVCCPVSQQKQQQQQQPQQQQSQQQQNIPSNRANQPNRGERISQRKCAEYGPPKKLRVIPAIVGGTETRPGEFSHMAAIGWRQAFTNSYDFKCGGALISHNFVLSAAHCASLGGEQPEVVRVGGIGLSPDSTVIPDIPITNIHVHPAYRRSQVYHDIALFQLAYNSPHQPACIYPSSTLSFRDVIAIGYGQTQFGGQNSKQLLKVSLKLFSNDDCKKYYTPGRKLESGIISSQICIGDLLKEKDTCQGDSGGPVLVKAKEVPFVIGITSFGQGCAGGPPSIYTRVASYLDWIESVVWPSG